MTYTPFNCLLILTAITLGKALTITPTDTSQDIVRVRYVSSTHAHRYRREADEHLPTEMHFNFRSRGNDVNLRLKRSSSNQPSDIPVYVIRDNGVVQENLPPIQNAASYLDKVMGAAVLVEKKPDGNFSLDGSYYDPAGRVQISPTEGDRHVLSWSAEVDYGHDFVLNFEGSSRPPRAHHRTKRQIVNEHTIGILMCADYKDYSQWVNYFKNQTLVKNGMRQYYAVVAQSMSLRYASVTDVDPLLKINIHITGLLIVDNPGKSNWTEDLALPDGTVEVRPVLRSFKNWVQTQTGRYSLPHSDHWMLFSGYDLMSNGNKVVAGLATLAAMCTQSSVSVIEQDFSASVGATASHELGHCLSAVHDGTSLAWNCPSSDNYVMSSKLVNPTENATASRPWEFSKCSVRAFRDYLSRVYCVREPDRNRSTLTNIVSTDIKPGQVYSSDIQCKLALGNGSYFGRGIQYARGFDTMCRGMYCAVPGKPRFFQKMFAMEKTTCGNGKWCLKGRCVADTEAPRTPEFCPQGDSPQERCNLQDCPFLTIEGKIGYCCKTCDTMSIRVHTLQSTLHQPSIPSSTPAMTRAPVWVQPVNNGGNRPVSNTKSANQPRINNNGTNQPPTNNQAVNNRPSEHASSALSNVRPDVFASIRGLFSQLNDVLTTNKISNASKNSAANPVPVSARSNGPVVPANTGNTGLLPAMGSFLTQGVGMAGTFIPSVNFFPANQRPKPPDRGRSGSMVNTGFSWDVPNEPVVAGSGLFFSNDQSSKPSQGQFQSLSGWIRNMQPSNSEPSPVTKQVSATNPVPETNYPQRVVLATLAALPRATANVQPATGTVRHRTAKSTTSSSSAGSSSGSGYNSPTITITRPANTGSFCVSCSPLWSVPREATRSAPKASSRPANLRNISWLRRSSLRFMTDGNVYSGVFIPVMGPRRTIEG